MSHVSTLITLFTSLSCGLAEFEGRKTRAESTFSLFFCRKQLIPRALAVVDFLAQMAESHEALRERILQCLSSWVSSRAISPESLLQTRIGGFPFEALQSEALFEAAVDCVEVLIEKSKYTSRFLDVACEIVRRLKPLQGRVLEGLRDKDETTLIGFGRIFLQTGETYSSLIVTSPENFAFVVEMITLLSGADNPPEVYRMAITFWSLVAETLDDEKYQEKRGAFSVPYQKLMMSLISRATYSTDQPTFSSALLEEIASSRHEIAEILRDCCHVIGGNECLAVAFSSLDTLLANPSNLAWTSVESVLFAIDAIGPTVDFHTSPTIPALMQGLLTLPNAAPQMQHAAIRVAVVKVFNSYSQWTRRNVAFLDPQVSFILAVFSGDNGAFQVDALYISVAALNALSKSCGKRLSSHLDTLFPLLSALPLTPIDLRAQADETTALLVSALPMEKLTASISALLQPVVGELHKIAASAQTLDIPPQLVVCHLARLGTILGNIKPSLYANPFDKSPTSPTKSPHACIGVMKEVWPILDRLFQQFSSSPLVLEALCECMSKFVANCKIQAEPFLAPFLAHLDSLFAATLHPCFLGAAELWLKVFCEREVCARHLGVFQKMLVGCTNPIQHRCLQGTPASAILFDSPEILVAYFTLLSTSTSYCSDALLDPYSPANGSLEGSLVITKLALRSTHQEGIDSMVAYLTAVLQVSLYGPFLRTKSSRSELSIPTTRNRSIEHIWRQHATELIVGVSTGVCSTFPITVSWAALGELYDMLGRYFGKDALALATKSGIEASTQGLVQQEIDDFLQNLRSDKRETNTERATVVFETFAELCRRRSGKREMGAGQSG